MSTSNYLQFPEEDRKKPLVALRGIKHGNRFWSCHNGNDPCYSGKGELWYEVIGFADTSEEAISLVKMGANKIEWAAHIRQQRKKENFEKYGQDIPSVVQKMTDLETKILLGHFDD